MKRTLTAVLAAVFAILGLAGISGTANAEKPAQKQQLNAHVSEFATRGPLGAIDEFIEICNKSPFPVDISGYNVQFATFVVSGELGPIPAATFLEPGQAYVIARIGSSVPANLYFDAVTPDIPDQIGFALVDPSAMSVDIVGTAPASVTPFVAGLPTAALTPLESTKSIHRHKFTGINKADFVKSWPRTPGTC